LERERLGLLQLRALGWLLGHHAGRGEHEAALGYGRRILAADPLREEVHRAVIGVQLAAGQPAAALRQYRQCEEVVRRELGTEPLPETRALLPLLLGADRAPGGERAAGPMSAARTGPDLSAALASLREAADLAERMGAYLRDATALLERVIARDGQDDDVPMPVSSHPHRSLAGHSCQALPMDVPQADVLALMQKARQVLSVLPV